MSSCTCGVRAEAIHKHWKRLAHRSRLLRFMNELRHKCVDRWTMWTRYSDVEKKLAARNWLSSLKSIISPLLKSNNLIIFLLEVIWQLGVARSQFFKFYQSGKKKPTAEFLNELSNQRFLTAQSQHDPWRSISLSLSLTTRKHVSGQGLTCFPTLWFSRLSVERLGWASSSLTWAHLEFPHCEI